MVFLFLKSHSKLSLHQIGPYFENSHSNVYTCLVKMYNWIETDKQLYNEYIEIKELLNDKKEGIKNTFELSEMWHKRIDKLQDRRDYFERHLVEEMKDRMINLDIWAKRFGYVE